MLRNINGLPNNRFNICEEVFSIGDCRVVNNVKMRVIRAMIQRERSVNWSMENIIN
jgi:hypothetical protein